MGRNHTFLKSQLDAVDLLLRKLSEEISPQFLGLITTSGHTLTYLAAADFNGDSDSLASLASGSFAATSQLARLMDDDDLTVTFQEGSRISIYTALVTDSVLLVICFGKATQIGKVRLLTRRMMDALSMALQATPPDLVPERLMREEDFAEGVGQAIDELFNVGGEKRGTD